MGIEMLDWIPILLGWIATILLSISVIAQLYTYYKTKDVTTLTYTFILFQFVVNILYLVSNISDQGVPQAVGNASMIILFLIMLGQKYYYTPSPLKNDMSGSSSDINNFIYSDVSLDLPDPSNNP